MGAWSAALGVMNKEATEARAYNVQARMRIMSLSSSK